MSTAIPTSAQPEPGDSFDWDQLDAEVFGPDTADIDREPDSEQVGSPRLAELTEDADTAEATEEPAPEAVATKPQRRQPRPLSTAMKWVVGLVILAVAALAGIGFVVSFDTQTRAVAPFFGDLAFLVPLAIDLGIVVFAALNLVLAYMNLSIAWMRAVPWALTAMTLYINLAAHDELIARVAHVALPGMWIVACEVGIHVIRHRVGLAEGTRTESLGVIRWVLAPVTTVRLWRHMRLWGLTTAGEARATEARRLEAKAALRYRYGLTWRAGAPVQLKVAYQLRRLTADEVYTWIPPVITAEVDAAPTAAPAEEPAPVRKPAAKPRPKPAGTKRPAPVREQDTELVDQLKALAGAEGGHVSIKRARREFGIGDTRAKRLLIAAGLLTEPNPATD